MENIKTDADAIFDTELNIKAEDIEPMITYGTNLNVELVFLKVFQRPSSRWSRNLQKSLAYMGFEEDDVMIGKPIDFVFLGS
jgi:3-isopropylmalate/(R)-2-methylmalate dehydratase large subunit